jgi:hypothetical protein
LGKVGVTVDTAGMRTGCGTPCERAKSRDDSTTAAPPSLVAQMSSSRSGSATTAEARTSSAVTSLR